MSIDYAFWCVAHIRPVTRGLVYGLQCAGVEVVQAAPIPVGGLARRPFRRYSYGMQPLRYSINVTLDGCCDHRAMPPDEDLHRHAVENLSQAGALLLGRMSYELMEAAWGPAAPTGARPD